MLINIPKNLNTIEPVMAGIYKVSVTGHKVEKAKSSDNLIIKPELTIQTQTDAMGNKVLGRKLFEQWVVAEANLPIWNTAFKALTGKELNQLGVEAMEVDEFCNLITSMISGKECLVDVQVKHQKKVGDKYESCAPDDPDNQPRNFVKKYSAIAG